LKTVTLLCETSVAREVNRRRQWRVFTYKKDFCYMATSFWDSL